MATPSPRARSSRGSGGGSGVLLPPFKTIVLLLFGLAGLSVLVTFRNAASVLRRAEEEDVNEGLKAAEESTVIPPAGTGGSADVKEVHDGVALAEAGAARRLEVPPPPPPSSSAARRRAAASSNHDMNDAIPYYLQGKYRFLSATPPPGESRRELLRRMSRDPTEPVPPPEVNATWGLNRPLKHATRNHDSVVLEEYGTSDSSDGDGDGEDRVPERVVIYTLLGRHSRYVQSYDLLTGRRESKRTTGAKDPAGLPLDDLNHVSAVLVDAVEPLSSAGTKAKKSDANDETKEKDKMNTKTKKEIWIPCGFRGDAVNGETSVDYARIVDVDTLVVRSGPRLPHSGGACVAAAVTILTSEPPMICAFAGTRGTHDAGVFLPQTTCYDRLRERWWNPFGPLPYGLDHGSLAAVPPGTCHEDDPGRILIFNFRTRPYGDSHPEVLAYDLPRDGWTLEELEKFESDTQKAKRSPENSEWYMYHNFTDLSLPVNEPRDASGVVLANGGRTVLNFGGTAHRIDPKTQKRRKVRFSMIRSLDVCDKEWSIVGDLGLATFALQSCGSAGLNLAVTCGGEAPLHNSNSPLCFASRWDGVIIEDQHAPISFVKKGSRSGGDGASTTANRTVTNDRNQQVSFA